ncbi:hypothetical protein CCUG60884_03805 [Mycobacteroides salmoniphilum]|uniref:Uncharacterized protein n=1 Tax=Mycobacteroides salmoniphilum TaxID=404941 RepID=A0A4R8SQM5_9MYCO|nr:hypothetical protein CCUG60884_03805 [Mycobacteroides salmoniphilum]
MSRSVHRLGGGLGRSGVALFFDDARDGGHIVGRADDIADRNVDGEDVAEQIREGEGGEGIAAQVDEVRVRADLGRGQPQQRCDRTLHGVEDRLAFVSGRVQGLKLEGLGARDIGVQLFKAGTVLLVQLGPGQLRDTGQQAVGGRERLGLHQEVAGHLVGLQLRVAGYLLK